MSRLLSRIKLETELCFKGSDLDIAKKAIEDRDFTKLQELVSSEIEKLSREAKSKLRAQIVEEEDSSSFEEAMNTATKELRELDQQFDRMEVLHNLELNLFEYLEFSL